MVFTVFPAPPSAGLAFWERSERGEGVEPCSGFPELLPEVSWEVGGEARPPQAGLGSPFTGLLQPFVESWELFHLA